MNTAAKHASEIKAGERFEFGRNWRRYLQHVDQARIERAERGLKDMLEQDSLGNLSFLDVGSGSGLMSLAARRLGASVHSFDYDPEAVGCTNALREQYLPADPDWIVEQGSILDDKVLNQWGRYDVVYSWGVLHHTGAMWRALENASQLVGDGGRLFIAIYNDQGRMSRCWAVIKRTYNRGPAAMKWVLTASTFAALWSGLVARDFLVGKPFDSWRRHRQRRGMSPWHDVVDWVGGYPFEVAKPEEIFEFFRRRGFLLLKLKTCGGRMGCNEFVFLKPSGSSARAERS